MPVSDALPLGGSMPALAEKLSDYTERSPLYERLDAHRLRCLACAHRCSIREGTSGICQVRFHHAGNLQVPFGYVNTVQCDPIEKKPFFHVTPGSRTLSFGMLGCALHCSYCENWASSQVLRDPYATVSFQPMEPEEVIGLAARHGAQWVISTFNEPLITAEWAVAIFRKAKAAGLSTGFVSNGNATPEVLSYLHPWVDIFKIDLKSFDDQKYRQLGAPLGPILDTIAHVHEMGVWLEVVTLLIPGFNDSPIELKGMAQYLASVSPDIPWHLTAFHRDYQMIEPPNTPAELLRQAVGIGLESGLRFVYAGNLPDQVGHLENTYCPECGHLAIRRSGFRVLVNRLDETGRCPECTANIPGLWSVGARHAAPEPTP